MLEMSLAEMKWQVKGFWPWVPMLRNSAETGLELMGVTDWIPASVPGGVHADLFRAGLIADPYKDANSLLCEWVENRWWVYKTEFPRPDVKNGIFELQFKGLDYEAIIYINGKLAGEHKGMFHPAVLDITEQIRDQDNVRLMVILKHAPDEMAQIGKTSLTSTQKSRFNYKWDFSTRLVNIGIWDDVVLKVHHALSLDSLYVRTDVDRQGHGVVNASAELISHGDAVTEAEGSIMLLDPQGRELMERHIRISAGQKTIEAEFQVECPELWYPNGYGGQPLYEVRLRLNQGATMLDEQSCRIGIRKLEYVRNVDSPVDALPYTFVVNGKKIYIKGVNLTPLDHLYGTVGAARYESMIRLARHGHINMIRVWGGGIIEKQAFYELCDRFGIMVWQEFIQSSSGIDNTPSVLPEFLELLEQTARAALKARRSHTCLTVWSGGNELMDSSRVPSTCEDKNLAMLQELVAAYDPQRLFLPTSASGPVEHITRKKGVSHDIHGWWKYEGNPGHYELYGESDSLFHSEFGVDGLSSVRSLRRFLSDEQLHPSTMENNTVWRHHGEWWDTYNRELNMFGSVPDLATFVACSQWTQAEGLRFILEANRRRKFRNSGSIVWQLNEPWPNAACTNLVDYYGEAKMAYYAARKAFSPDHVSLDYRRLNYKPGEAFNGGVFVHRAGLPAYSEVTAQVLDVTGQLLHEQRFQGHTEMDKALAIGSLAFEVPATSNDLFFVRLRLAAGGDSAGGDSAGERSNLYIFSTSEQEVYAPALKLGEPALHIEQVEEYQEQTAHGTEWSCRYRIVNTDEVAALHLYPEETSGRFWTIADGAYESLFPGETGWLTVSCTLRTEGPFESLQGDGAAEPVAPVIRIKSFQSSCSTS